MRHTHLLVAMLLSATACGKPECTDILDKEDCVQRDDCRTLQALECEDGETVGDWVFGGCYPRGEGCGDMVSFAEYDGQCFHYADTCIPTEWVAECVEECDAYLAGYGN